MYGVDAKDAGAGTWTGRYMFFGESSAAATSRMRDAGFHRQDIRAWCSPARLPSGAASRPTSSRVTITGTEAAWETAVGPRGSNCRTRTDIRLRDELESTHQSANACRRVTGHAGTRSLGR